MKNKPLVPSYLSSKVLTLGADYITYKGGIGGLIAVYAKFFERFKCVITHKDFKYKVRLIPFFIVRFFKVLVTLTIDREIKIVHIHGSSYGSFYRKYVLFLVSKYLMNRKVIYHIHGSEYEIFYRKSLPVIKRLIVHLINNADVVICLSKSWHSFFDQNFSPKRLYILDNTTIFPARVKSLKEPDGKLNLLFLGAIGDRKGIFDLLEVLAQHPEDFRGRLTLTVGGNGQVDRFNEFVEMNGLEDLVDFKGWVAGDLKLQLLSEADVFILPSYNEGLPMSILEAMSFGLPILSTPIGGIPEVVINNRNGYLFEPGDKKVIYECLLKLVTNPELVVEMGKESEVIIQRYSPNNVLTKLCDIYQELLNVEPHLVNFSEVA